MRIINVSGGNGVLSYALKSYIIGNIEPRKDYYIRNNTPQWDLNYTVPMVTKIDPFIDEKVDIVMGHPKCGAYSILALSRGKTFKESKEEPSLTLFLSSINHYLPKIFLMENLPKLLESHTKESFIKLFPTYRLTFLEGPVTLFGNSQETRKRLIIIGVAKRLKRSKYISSIFLEEFGPACRPKPMKVLLEGTEGLNGDFNENLSELVTLYAGCKMTWEDIQCGWEKLYPNKRWLVHDRNFSTAPGVWNTWDEHTPLTIRKTNRQFYQGKPLTPRQLARCQGLPDEFQILDEGHEKTTLLNKGRITMGSSPPFELGEWFLSCLKKSNFMKLQEKYK